MKVSGYTTLVSDTKISAAIPDELTEHNYVTITQINHINLHTEYADECFKSIE